MSADIHTFLSATPYIPPAVAEEIRGHWRAVKAGRPPLGYLQRKWVEETYGPRREHPPCLSSMVTPPIHNLNDWRIK